MPIEDRHLLAALVTWILLGNHWVRDSIGALELPLESNATGYGLSPRQYNSLNAIYFLPNVLMPIVSGVMAQRRGAAKVLVEFLRLLFLGSVLTAAGALIASALSVQEAHSDVPYGLTLAGRALAGIAYESVDMTPIGLLSPRFRESWASVVGIINGLNRGGSVLSFLLEPLVYTRFGMTSAMILPSLLGFSALLAGLIAKCIDKRLRQKEEGEQGGGIDEMPPLESGIANAQPPAVSRVRSRSFSFGNGITLPSIRLRRPKMPTFEDVFGASPQTLQRGFGKRHTWLFLMAAGCVYGCMVPFWFCGAKHISLKWGHSLEAADALMLFPEGLIAIISPVVGFGIDYLRLTATQNLLAAAFALALMPLSLLLLAWLPASACPPLPLVLLLAAGYAVCQTLIWASVVYMGPRHLVNILGGLIGSSVNLLPTLLPGLVLSGSNLPADLTILSVVGFFGIGAFVGAAIQVSGGVPSDAAEDVVAASAKKKEKKRNTESTKELVRNESSNGSGWDERPLDMES